MVFIVFNFLQHLFLFLLIVRILPLDVSLYLLPGFRVQAHIVWDADLGEAVDDAVFLGNAELVVSFGACGAG